MQSEARLRLANRVALANGAVFLLIPFLLVMSLQLASTGMQNGSVTVHAGGDPGLGDYFLRALAALVFCTPVAAVVVWRTQAHALARVDDNASGWWGVGEAAAIGFSVAMTVLLPGILLRPLEAPPYVISYGGAAALIGALLGLLLRTTALLWFRILRPTADI